MEWSRKLENASRARISEWQGRENHWDTVNGQGSRSTRLVYSFLCEIFLTNTFLDYEVSLLRLFEKISNGSLIEISHTGTAVLFKPGVLTGGPISHDCPLSRSVGYFLEPIVALAPFSKKPLMLTLKGITTDDKDLGVDLIRTVTLPTLAIFGVEDGVEFKVCTSKASQGLK